VDLRLCSSRRGGGGGGGGPAAPASGTAGTANTGGGGGAGSPADPSGGAGGSGIVIVNKNQQVNISIRRLVTAMSIQFQETGNVDTECSSIM
jgi:hypothetical protein